MAPLGAAKGALVFFTHIFAPYVLREGSLAFMETELIFQSWQRAAAEASKAGIEVEFLACVLPKDMPAVPRWARAATPLTFYALDPDMHQLPTIGEIWKRGVNEGRGRYLMYTNLDIGAQPDLYIKAHELLVRAEKRRDEALAQKTGDAQVPWTALEFTRVQSLKLRKDMKNPPSVEDAVTNPSAGRHPGHDCFVVPRQQVPSTLMEGGLVVGMPPWGTMYHYEISQDPHLRLLFMHGTASERYTFHTGVEGTAESWMTNQDFRLQQYSEAFRLFGPDVVGHAWGAKGRHSPFYFLCNATQLRYPACDFCEAFYPSTMYPELKKHRECRGLMTERSFFMHLPTPTRTQVPPAAQLSTAVVRLAASPVTSARLAPALPTLTTMSPRDPTPNHPGVPLSNMVHLHWLVLVLLLLLLLLLLLPRSAQTWPGSTPRSKPSSATASARANLRPLGHLLAGTTLPAFPTCSRKRRCAKWHACESGRIAPRRLPARPCGRWSDRQLFQPQTALPKWALPPGVRSSGMIAPPYCGRFPGPTPCG